MVDLSAYFARIGYAGSPRPTLANLHAISLAHTQSIPFENLDVLLGRAIDLAPEAVDQKLIFERRGGYCFEQNTLLLRVLQTMGYEATPLSARVRYQRPRDFTPPRTHVFVRVVLDEGTYLADVGVGAMSLTAALEWSVGREQLTPHEPRRIVFEDHRYFHQVRFGDDWHDVAEFTLEEMPPIDREVANWFTSAHPLSHFKNRLLVARASTDGGRISILNRELSFRDHAGAKNTHLFDSREALLAALLEHFGLAFPAGTEFQCPALDWP